MRKKLIVSLAGILLLAYLSFGFVLIAGIRPTLGLDLQGGVSVTQEPKAGSSFSSASLDLAVEKIRERVDALGVAEPEILRQGETIVVNLPGVRNVQQAIDLVQVTGQVYLRPVMSECQTLTLNPDTSTTVAGGSTTVAGSTTTGGANVGSPSTAPTTTAAGGPGRAVSGTNTTTTTTVAGTTTATTSGTSTTVAGTTVASTTTLPGTTTTNPDAPSTTAAPVDENGLPIPESDPNNTQFLPVAGSDPPQYCLVGPQQGTGEIFQDNAGARIIPTSGWGVSVDLRSGAAGNDVWNSLASQCFNRQASCPTGQLAIELDGTLQSVANVQTDNFQGSVQISGAFSEGEARTLARVINSGSLPVQLQLQSVQNVSPTLGKDSLRAAWVSGLVGVLLVLLFMIFYYRALGFIVAAGLTVSGAILWSVISILSRTQGLALSLSGIAGIIVAVGVTVDSYVVFFERLKDEVRSGKSLRNSAQRGFAGAWRTIVIADLVSLIGAFVLWYLTVGAVRGFAFFLGLSTACDLLVSYFFTRPTVLLLARTKWMERRKVMGIEVAPAGVAS